MRTADYLDAAQKAMGITSDYELARRLSVSKQRISAYRSGKEWPDNYIVMKLAVALNADPVSVLADLESQREKNPERAEFWRSFLSRAALLVILACTLAWISTDILLPEAGLISGGSGTDYADGLRIICIMSTQSIRALAADLATLMIGTTFETSDQQV